jgi:OLD-like protein
MSTQPDRGRLRFEPPAGGPEATRRALARAAEARAIVLVEGLSDQIAVETLAERLGRDLPREGFSVLPIGGAHAIGGFLKLFRGTASGLSLAGLCDAGEEEVFRRGLEDAGFGTGLTRTGMERLGFHVCVADLEDELIRALGPGGVEAVLEEAGDLAPFRTFQKQPAWRGQRADRQLRRFLGSADRRKLRYARLLVEALEPATVPGPLAGVLAHV